MLLGALIATLARGEPAKEYQVKAAFLYNFTKFIEWPEGRLPRDESPIVIGVLGRNPFASELENVVRGRKINGHAIAIRVLAAAEDASGVQAVFVPAGEEKRLEPEIAALHRLGVLTIGESARFGELGGIITFVMIDDKVRFEINTPAAEQAGLKVSAQLQKLANPPRKP